MSNTVSPVVGQQVRPLPPVTTSCAVGEASSLQSHEAAALARKDENLIRLFLTASFHEWNKLPGLAQSCYDAGSTVAEVRGCIRHMCVLAGYAPALAAAKQLHGAGLLPEEVAGKAGGPPGDTFDLVYGPTVRDKIWASLYRVDAVIAEWIRTHTYGDVYSTPGLSLRQKQLITSAFLAEADMQLELFGHLLAAMTFGASVGACRRAVEVALEISPYAGTPTGSARREAALKWVEGAAEKLHKLYPDGVPPEPQITISDPTSVRIPTPPHQQ
eukprot:jgi/Botrbrau1/4103/Bobra.152_3s0051.1